VAAVLAIAIGGGLGHWVGTRDAESEAGARPVQAIKPTVKPIEVEAPPPAPANTVPTQPDHEIEIEPDPVTPGASPVVRHAKPRPKQPPKSSKHTPCNVYDHMDGC
jgi:hypothetical protein